MASANISFDAIPSSIRKPGKYFEFNTKLAVRNLPGNPQKVLLVGQRLSTGTVAANEIVDVFSDDQAASYFGAGSVAHLMVRAAIVSNPYVSLSVVAVDDAEGGVAATGKIALTGDAVVSGAVAVVIAGKRLDIAINPSDSLDIIANRIASAINTYRESPLTALASQSNITLTAKHKGETGNYIYVGAVNGNSGVTLTVTALANGQNNPSIAPALAQAFAGGHNIVVCPFDTQAALRELREHIEAVGSPMEQRDAIGVAATSATLSAATTVATAINSGLITLAWYPGAQRSAAELAAAYASVVASEEDPARPLNGLEIKSADVVPVHLKTSRVEQENAMRNGLTPLEVGPGDRVQVVRALSTYTKNAENIEDVSLLDITTMRTLHFVRKACRERIALRFPREKLSIRTPAKVRSELLDVLLKLEQLEILEEVEANKSGLLVERDLQDVNRLNAVIPSDVVNGLHVFAGRIDLLL